MWLNSQSRGFMLNKIGTTFLKNEKNVKTKKRQQLIATCVSVDETSPLHSSHHSEHEDVASVRV